MTIEVGDALPETTFYVAGPDGIETRTTSDVFKGRTVVLFAVPGAFTPTCDRNHLPGFLKNAARIKATGVDTIAVTGVNDAFVMQAWAKSSGGEGTIEFLSDGNAEFAKAVGLAFDASQRGLGTRSQRYSMVVEDGTVTALAVEEAPGKADLSGAEALLRRREARA